MVRLLSIISLAFLAIGSKSFAQGKDLVFGDVTKEEIISSIQFADSSCYNCSAVRIDNAGSGEPILIVLSDMRVSRVNDFRRATAIQLSQVEMKSALAFLERHNSGITQYPGGYGTFRVALKIGRRLIVYYVQGGGNSYEFFLELSKTISGKSEAERALTNSIETILKMVKPRSRD